MKKYFAILAVAFLSACSSMPQIDAVENGGPVVEGKLSGSTAKVTIPFSAYTTGSPVIATEAYAMPRGGASILSPFTISNVQNGNKVWIGKYTTGSGHKDAPKDLGKDSQYLLIGGLEYSPGTYRGIGFGYSCLPDCISPVFAGMRENDGAGGTNGDFVIATRSVTTNIAPTVRLSITNTGQIVADKAYSPATDEALTTKKYVDGLIKTLQDKLDALRK